MMMRWDANDCMGWARTGGKIEKEDKRSVDVQGMPVYVPWPKYAKIKLVWNLEPCLLQEPFVDV